MNLIIVYKVFIIYIVLLSERLVSAGCCKSTSGSDSKNDPAYTKSDDKNDCSKTSNKTGVDLNILDRQNSSDHTFQSNNNVDTFTPKANKAFKKVKTSRTDIWSTDKQDEYASKVEVSRTGNDRVVTIHTGGKTKKFKKDSDKWKEEGQGDQNSTDKTGTTGASTTPASGTTGSGTGSTGQTTPTSGGQPTSGGGTTN